MVGAVGGGVVGHVVAEDDEAAVGDFDGYGFILLWPVGFAQLFQFALAGLGTDLVDFAERAVVAAGFYPEAAVVLAGVFEGYPEADYGGGFADEVTGILVPADFAADSGLFEDVHGLP